MEIHELLLGWSAIGEDLPHFHLSEILQINLRGANLGLKRRT